MEKIIDEVRAHYNGKSRGRGVDSMSMGRKNTSFCLVNIFGWCLTYGECKKQKKKRERERDWHVWRCTIKNLSWRTIGTVQSCYNIKAPVGTLSCRTGSLHNKRTECGETYLHEIYERMDDAWDGRTSMRGQ